MSSPGRLSGCSQAGCGVQETFRHVEEVQCAVMTCVTSDLQPFRDLQTISRAPCGVLLQSNLHLLCPLLAAEDIAAVQYKTLN